MQPLFPLYVHERSTYMYVMSQQSN